MATPRSEATKPRRRWPMVLAIVGGVLVASAVALLIYANVENTADDLPEAVSAESRERNTLIATSLVVAGINDSIVDVTPERVYVAYEIPASAREGSADASAMNETRTFFQQFVLGAAAEGAPGSNRTVVAQYEGEALRLVWSVETAKVTAFQDGALTEEELMAAIEMTSHA